VRVDGSAVLVPLLLGFTLLDLREAATFMVVAIVSVTVHELGHVIAFRRRGGIDARIVLRAGGGFAVPSGECPRRQDRIWVYASGTLTAFGVLGLPALLLRSMLPSPPALLSYLVWLNVYFGASNLLPVLPLDGGLIARDGLQARFGTDRGDMFARRLSVVAGVVSAFLLLGPLNAGAVADPSTTPVLLRTTPWLMQILLALSLFGYAMASLHALMNPGSEEAMKQIDQGFLALCEGDLDGAARLARDAHDRRANRLVRAYAAELSGWVALTAEDERAARRAFGRARWRMRDRSHLRVALLRRRPTRKIAATVRCFQSPQARLPAPIHVDAMARDGVLDRVEARLMRRGSGNAELSRFQFMAAVFRAGRYEHARQLGERLLPSLVDPGPMAFNLACCCAKEGDVDAGIEWLERSFGEFRYANVAALTDDPDLEALRADERFVDLEVRATERAQASRSVPTPR
jgi:Zn-dependent protease